MSKPKRFTRLFTRRSKFNTWSTLVARSNHLSFEHLEMRQMLTTFSVSGNVKWTDGAGGLHNVPLATVEVVEHDTVLTSVIGTAQTDQAGNYSLTISYDDGVLQGNPDVSVRVLARSAVADVKPTGLFASTYSIESATVDEVAEGAAQTFNLVAGNVLDNETAFSVHHALVLIGAYTGNLTGVTPSQIDTRYDSSVTGSYFSSSAKQLVIRGTAKFEWDVIHHEYGHYVQNIHAFQANPGGTHSSTQNLSVQRGSEAIGLPLAWGEGWPTFFAISGQVLMGASGLGIPQVGDNSYQAWGGSINQNVETSTGLGEDNELSVIATLWDAFDGASTGSEKDEVTISPNTMFNAFKSAGVTTMGAAWNALAATLDNAGKARLCAAFAQNKISPNLLGPNDNETMGQTPLEFKWQKNGGGAANPLNDFRIRFYSSDFSRIIFEKAVGDVDTYTPTAEEWTTIRAEGVVKWVIEGRNTTGVATPGGSPGYYWSGAKTLGGVSIVMVIDDTGSMGEEIDGVKTALQQYIDTVVASLPPGATPPAMQLITFKDNVTTRITSTDLAAVRAAVGGLFASGGGDCPEASAQALAAAVESVAPGGNILLATDASTQPGVDNGSVLARLRAKGVTLNTILTGDCGPIASVSALSAPESHEYCEDCAATQWNTSPVGSVTAVSETPETIQPATGSSSNVTSESMWGAASEPSPDGSDVDAGPQVQIVDAGQTPIDDHSNTISGATSLFVNKTPLLGNVGRAGDAADFFSINLAGSTPYAVHVQTFNSATVVVEVMAADGVTVLSAGSVFREGHVFITPPVAGTYFVKVSNGGSGIDTYLVDVTDDPLAGVTSAVDLFSTLSALTGGAFLVRDNVNAGSPEDFVASIYNVLASTLGPAVIAASPADAPQGQTLEITLTGRSTNWRDGDTNVAFSNSGIQVLAVDVTSPTTLNVVIQVGAAVPIGSYNATVTTALGGATETALGSRVLEVTPATTAALLLSVTPGNLSRGSTTTVGIRGGNVAWNNTAVVSLGVGTTVSNLRVISPTHLLVDVDVDDLADIGFRTAEVSQSGQPTVSLGRAVFIGVTEVGIPQITLVNPNSGNIGQTLAVSIQATNTNFVNGVTTADFGVGVEILSVQVTSPTSATVNLRILAGAAEGFRNVALTTGGETAVALGSFFVSTEVALPSITGFTLINAETDQPIRTILDGEVINLNTLPTRKLNIRANTDSPLANSVRFDYDGALGFHVENDDPFALFGDSLGNYFVGSLATGIHTLTATPFDGTNGHGNVGIARTISFSVVEATFAVNSFTLINADTDQPIRTIVEGDVIDLSSLPTKNINVRANVSSSAVSSVRFDYDGDVGYRVESDAPYALFGDSSGNFNAGSLELGLQTLTATPFDADSAHGKAGVPLRVNFTVVDSALAVTSFTLINADTDQPIRMLVDGDVIDLASLPTNKLNVRANVRSSLVESVLFKLDGVNNSIENKVPYALFGDLNGDYQQGFLAPGAHTLEAIPYSRDYTQGEAGFSLRISFTVLGTAGALAGDSSRDGKVDAADFVLLRKQPSSTAALQSVSSVAAAGTSAIVVSGYDAWKTHFGDSLPGSTNELRVESGGATGGGQAASSAAVVQVSSLSSGEPVAVEQRAVPVSVGGVLSTAAQVVPVTTLPKLAVATASAGRESSVQQVTPAPLQGVAANSTAVQVRHADSQAAISVAGAKNGSASVKKGVRNLKAAGVDESWRDEALVAWLASRNNGRRVDASDSYGLGDGHDCPSSEKPTDEAIEAFDGAIARAAFKTL